MAELSDEVREAVRGALRRGRPGRRSLAACAERRSVLRTRPPDVEPS